MNEYLRQISLEFKVRGVDVLGHIETVYDCRDSASLFNTIDDLKVAISNTLKREGLLTKIGVSEFEDAQVREDMKQIIDNIYVELDGLKNVNRDGLEDVVTNVIDNRIKEIESFIWKYNQLFSDDDE